MRVRILLLLTCFALAGFAPAPLPRPQRHPREDLTDVVGTWEFVRWDMNGMRMEQMEQTWRADVTKEQFTLVGKVRVADRQEYPMRLEPTASPPAFVWHTKGVVNFVGSYRLRGDHMTFLLQHGDRKEARPTDFDSPPATGYRFVMRRIKRGK
jgi:uncharacterized protein (TIGR03067 family)